MLRGTGTANWVQGMTVQPIDCDTDIHALDTTEQMNLDLQMTSEMAQLSHDNAMIWAALTGGWTPGKKLREVCPTSCGDCSPDAHGLSLSGLECATNHQGDAEATCSRSSPAVTSTCKPPAPPSSVELASCSWRRRPQSCSCAGTSRCCCIPPARASADRPSCAQAPRC